MVRGSISSSNAGGMKVLSLFDGLSCAQQALKELGVQCEYYASEIDPYAIAVTQSNFPNTVQLGDVTGIQYDSFDKCLDVNNYLYNANFDLLIGGSPCQDLSIAKKNREGLAGSRSGLFWEYVRIRDEVKPKYFVLENVASMPKEAKQVITDALGVEPVMIDAALVSAQRRKRLFWVGKLVGDKYEQVHIDQPEDRGILLKDILEQDGVALTERRTEEAKKIRREYQKLGRDYSPRRAKELVPREDGKANTITTGTTKEMLITDSVYQYRRTYWREIKGGKVPTLSTSAWEHNHKVNGIRNLTTTECLRLQSLPDDYFDKATYKGKPISNTQRYKMVGNSFNCEVVKHILNKIV